MLSTHLAAQYRDDADVSVVGHHLYPVESDNKLLQTSDLSAVFGCPHVGHDVFPQVVFDVLVPGWRYSEMRDKFAFYERHGAEEYYILYPEFPAHAEGYLRSEGKFVRVEEIDGFVSPRLGVRFSLARGQLAVFGSDGQRMRTAAEIAAERERLAAKLRELGVDPDTV